MKFTCKREFLKPWRNWEFRERVHLISSESPNKETGSGIAGLRNILFAITFQAKVCYWWVTFIPSSSHFSTCLSRVITNNQTPGESTAPALFCLEVSLLLISLGKQAGYSPCVFLYSNRNWWALCSHSDGKGQSRSKYGFAYCGNTSQGWGSSQGWVGRAAQNSVRSCMALAIQPAQWPALWAPLLWRLQRACFQTDGGLPSQ